MNRVDRLMAYLLLLQSRGLMRAQDFAERFEISERTVYRDIQALSEVGVPIMAMPGEGYRLMEGYYLPPISFTPEEARALFLAVSMLAGFTAVGPTQTAVFTAQDKIRAVLPARTRRQAEALQAILRIYAFPAPAINFDDPTFLRLQEAIHERRLVRLRYHAQRSNVVTERDVEPHEFVLLDKVWMLQAFCRLRQAPRAFRLDRIDGLIVKQETFTPRDIPSREPVPGPIEVVIQFDPAVVRWVRERQHFSFVGERPSPHHPGAVLMTYRPTNGFDQFAPWALQWGHQMEVLEPAAWREQLAATAVQIARRHQTGH